MHLALISVIVVFFRRVRESLLVRLLLLSSATLGLSFVHRDQVRLPQTIASLTLTLPPQPHVSCFWRAVTSQAVEPYTFGVVLTRCAARLRSALNHHSCVFTCLERKSFFFVYFRNQTLLPFLLIQTFFLSLFLTQKVTGQWWFIVFLGVFHLWSLKYVDDYMSVNWKFFQDGGRVARSSTCTRQVRKQGRQIAKTCCQVAPDPPTSYDHHIRPWPTSLSHHVIHAWNTGLWNHREIIVGMVWTATFWLFDCLTFGRTCMYVFDYLSLPN